MTHDLKPYPAMKDSGVQWLGEMPQHWAVERLKSSVSNVIEQTAQRRDADLYVALEHVESWTGRLRHAGSDVTFDSQVKRFRSGDVLFGKLRPYLAKVTRPRSGGVCVGEFFVLRPRDSSLATPYVEQVLRSKPIIDAINSSTFGAKMPRADWQFVGGMSVPRPPVPEQAAIVRFLDHADRRIRRYIRAKQKLIKLLEEQKRAIIHRAVTRGLDPNVRLKPSGVEWLGDVPENWEVRSFTRCAIERADYRGAIPTKTESGVFLVTARNVRKGRIDYEVSKEFVAANEYEDIMRRGLPRLGDLLLTMEAPLGNAALVDREDVAFAQRVVRFRFALTEFVPQFVLHAVLSPYFQNQLLRRGTGSTALGIKASKLPQLQLLCPPLVEQTAIVERIGEEQAPVESAAPRAQREISLLREYRTRLIADVVTGKLDVRAAAAGLPDETRDEAADEPPDGDDSLETDESEDDEAGLEGEEAPV